MPSKPKTHYQLTHPDKDWQSRYERQKADGRFYMTPAWRATRATVLAQEPLCRACKRDAANEVDHIVPRLSLPQSQWLEASNLQPLCKACHSAKTAASKLTGKSVRLHKAR